MGLKTGLVLGLGIGYVLGAKAGRERYDQIVEAFADFTARPEVQDLTAKGKALVDLAAERAKTAGTG